jgi:hypothetical protein
MKSRLLRNLIWACIVLMPVMVALDWTNSRSYPLMLLLFPVLVIATTLVILYRQKDERYALAFVAIGLIGVTAAAVVPQTETQRIWLLWIARLVS